MGIARGGYGHGSPAKIVVEFKSTYDRRMAYAELVNDLHHITPVPENSFTVCAVPVEFTVAKCPTCGHVE